MGEKGSGVEQFRRCSRGRGEAVSKGQLNLCPGGRSGEGEQTTRGEAGPWWGSGHGVPSPGGRVGA